MNNINDNKYDIAYICSTLKRVGPSNQTLNIIKYSLYKEKSVIITLFEENVNDSMIEEYKKANIDIIALQLNPKNILSWKRKLRKALKETAVKIAHSYGIIPDYLTQKSCKNVCTHVITLRNFPKEDIFTRMNYLPALLAYNIHINTLLKADNIVACSNTIRDKMKFRYPNINITSIQNGVDIEKFKKVNSEEKSKLREKYGISKDKIVFISTSSFIPRKRIEETIIAFNNAKLSNKHLLLLGVGTEYETLYNKYNSNKDIEFIGKTDKVLEYLQLSDVFISSSESEGLPNGVIEAISCGLPVILSNIPQHKEVLEEIGCLEWLYKLGNIEELKKRIEKIQIGSKDYKIEESNLTMKNMSQQYARYYQEILNRGNTNE